MADMNVNLQGNMDRLGSILRNGEVDKAELSEDIDTLFEEKQDGSDEAVDANEYIVSLASHSDAMTSDQVNEYFEIMREFAAMDGDGTTFSQTEITLMKQILAGEDTSDTEAALKDLSSKQAEIDKLEEEKNADQTEETKETDNAEEETKNTTLSDREVALMADKMHAAMEGWGTDEVAVQEVLLDESLTGQDIVNIMNYYESKYGETLEHDIRWDFSGKAQKELLGVLDGAVEEVKQNEKANGESSLTDREVELMADKLHQAMKGWGTDEAAVEEVLYDPSLTSADVLKIMDAFEAKYGESLEKDIRGDFSGKAQKGLLEVLEKAEKGEL